MAVASYMSPVSPPPSAAQFAEVTVDTKTGQLWVHRLVMAVDSGMIINPLTTSGQIEGGMSQALGYAACEETGTQSHRIFRMRDKGIGHLHGSGRGDQLVRIIVHTPESVSKDERKLLEQLQQLERTELPPPRRGNYGVDH